MNLAHETMLDLTITDNDMLLSGALTFAGVEAKGASVLAMYQAYLKEKSVNDIVVSARDVSQVDSAGLSLLTEMMAQASACGARFVLTEKSAQMTALMTFYGVLALFSPV